MNLTTFFMTLLGIAVGVLAGILLHAWWLRRQSEVKLLAPATWPLRARGVVTTQEHNVWKWLRSAFPDHIVMAKVPVLRFTIPIERDEGTGAGQQWLELLNGVYTTFTVCTTEGKVVGCVDVHGKRGLSKSSRDLKDSLLSDCGIPYTVVLTTRLPPADAMRAAFLGEIPGSQGQEDQDHQETRVDHSSFHEELDSFTRQRVKTAKEAALKELNKDSYQGAQPGKNSDVGFNADGSGTIRSPDDADRFAVQWDDSFIQPLDTRPAKLD